MSIAIPGYLVSLTQCYADSFMTGFMVKWCLKESRGDLSLPLGQINLLLRRRLLFPGERLNLPILQRLNVRC